MIPVRIDHDGANDNYRALALYIADASIGKNQSEKTLHSWYIGFDADSYLEGMIEVEAIQDQKPDIENKTYHLVVSFRPEDEPKLSKEVLMEIETMLASALGYSDHQRHCGVHVNTDNLHLHIAFNRINPQTLNAYTPYYDFPKLHRACRMIEQKFGLEVDKGMEPEAQGKEPKASAKVRTLEAQTGQESFYNYVLRHKEDINLFVSQAESWQDIHEGFLKMGLTIKLSGNGLTIKDRYAKHYAKPSAIDRALSKKHLVEQFGDFQDPSKNLLRYVQATETYTARPLHHGSERDGLYDIYLEEMRQRKETIRAIKEEGQRAYRATKDEWQRKKAQIKKIPMLAADRQRVLNKAQTQETMALEKIREAARGKLDEIRKKRPFTSWARFLQYQAGRGNETALAILRSKKAKVQPDQITPPSYTTPRQPQTDVKTMIIEAHGLTNTHRQALLAVVKMREMLASLPGQAVQEFKYTIDTKGTVIFKLANGGTIRDTGRKIHFSSRDDQTKELAMKYAAARWGQANIFKGKVLQRSPDALLSIEASSTKVIQR
ncbi:relaxase/mobilization nuclease domain-containing protein [Deltaproteobacteria bacterium OttesenSCG-928-M10]|nr:relaxase/mobilization nuclease domain-containing protein [Deltaproteobacteria bacterium OttesenSCG-928-M10]